MERIVDFDYALRAKNACQKAYMNGMWSVYESMLGSKKTDYVFATEEGAKAFMAGVKAATKLLNPTTT